MDRTSHSWVRSQPKVVWIVAILGIGLIAYSSGAIFIRIAIAETEQAGLGFSLFLSAARLALASLIMLPAWRGFPQARYPRRMLCCSLMAGLCLSIYFATWVTSLSYTSITASTTLVNTHPIWIALISWILYRHKLDSGSALGIGVALAGSIVIGWGPLGVQAHSGTALTGNLLALGGGLAIGAYILLGRQAQCAGINTRHHAVLVYSTAAFLLLPLPLLLGVVYTGHSNRTYLCILLMALITQLVGHTSFTWAMKWVRPIPLALVLLGEPLVASILGWLVFHEIPPANVLAGSSLVMVGAVAALLHQT